MATTPTRPLWPLVIFGLIAALILLSDRAPQPRPNPEPRPAGPDLVAVFAAAPDRDKARTDALAFSHLCESLAIKIEYDGRLAAPRITTGAQCDELRRWAREYGLSGGSFADTYPRLPDVIKTYMDAALGTSGGPIDVSGAEGKTVRQKWVDSLRAISQSAEYAANTL